MSGTTADAIREHPEERLGEQPGGRPGGDHDPERCRVDALLAHEQGQDRQNRAKAEPDHGFGEEQRQQWTPPAEPAARGCRERGDGHDRTLAPRRVGSGSAKRILPTSIV